MALDVLPLYPIGDHRGPLAAEAIGWDDLQGAAQQGVGAGALTSANFRDTPFRLLTFRAPQDDSLSFAYQMSHRWKPGTAVRPHVHFLPLTDPAVVENVRFAGSYAWVVVGSELPANASWVPFTIDVPISPGDVNKEKIGAMTLITPPANAVESAILCVFWQRPGASDPLDTYGGSIGLISFDCHIQVQKAGTNPVEFPP